MGRMAGLAGDAAWGGRACFFIFHRCAPSAQWAGLPNRDFYLDAGFLDTLLAYLARTGWSVVTVEDSLQRLGSGRGGRFVNFSVDDCYRDTFETVVPIFRKHGVPVTLFVTTGIPDATMPMWGAGLETVLLERAAVVVDGVTLDVGTSDAKRQAYADISARWDAGDTAALYQAFCVANGVTQDALHGRNAITWPMLRELSTDPLVEIGAHTVSHRRLSALPDDQAEQEIGGSGDRLRQQLGVPCRHFAFPYGRRADCGPREFAITRRTGFSSGATTRKGLLRRGDDAFSLPRNTLNGAHQSTRLVEAHLTGLSGLAARALGRV